MAKTNLELLREYIAEVYGPQAEGQYSGFDDSVLSTVTDEYFQYRAGALLNHYKEIHAFSKEKINRDLNSPDDANLLSDIWMYLSPLQQGWFLKP